MSFRLSAHAVWADKGDLAHYTSMTWVPPDCRKSRIFSQQDRFLSPKRLRVVLAHAMAVQAHTDPPPPGWCACISDKALASCLSPKAVRKE